MNIEKLVAAAQEIERLCVLQEERTKRLAQLASQAKRYSEAGNAIALRAVQSEARMMGCQVTDFGDAINDLRRALKAKPAKKSINQGERVAV